MNIGLIDIDYNSSFPNIPLMKISAYHKAHGDNVHWYNTLLTGRCDIVYMAKVFSWTENYNYPIDADKVIYGGTGFQIKTINGMETMITPEDDKRIFIKELPDEIEHIYPDYSLYGDLTKNTAYGFLTRGCPRGCNFCHVGTKEGYRSRKVADLTEFYNGQSNIVLCDPNILACKDWRDLLEQLVDSGAKVDFNQGLDVRLMTEEKAQLLTNCKTNSIHFAWDNYNDKDIIIDKLQLFRRVYEQKHKWYINGTISVYVLVNFNTTFEQDLDRIYTLRNLGYWAYVMVYNKKESDVRYRHLQRWVNNRLIFAQCNNFDNYMKKQHSPV